MVQLRIKTRWDNTQAKLQYLQGSIIYLGVTVHVANLQYLIVHHVLGLVKADKPVYIFVHTLINES